MEIKEEEYRGGERCKLWVQRAEMVNYFEANN